MLDVLARALDAGVRLVQLREKALDREVLEALAEQVLSLTARYDAMLLINESRLYTASAADIAVKIGRAGCAFARWYIVSGGPRSGWTVIFNRLFHTYPCGIRLR